MFNRTSQRLSPVVRILAVGATATILGAGLFMYLTPDPQTCVRSFITNVARCHPTKPNEHPGTTYVFTRDY